MKQEGIITLPDVKDVPLPENLKTPEEQLASFTYEAYEVNKIYGMYAMAIQEYCMRKFKVVRV